MTIEQLKLKDINELKILSWDTQSQLEGLRQSLQIINQLIIEKQPAQVKDNNEKDKPDEK